MTKQEAERAGHSVEVHLRVYAKCLDKGQAIASKRIEAALWITVEPPGAILSGPQRLNCASMLRQGSLRIALQSGFTGFSTTKERALFLKVRALFSDCVCTRSALSAIAMASWR